MHRGHLATRRHASKAETELRVDIGFGSSAGQMEILMMACIATLLIGIVIFLINNEEEETLQPQKSPIQATPDWGATRAAQRSNQEPQDPLQQVEYSDGSWAKAYREAQGQRREALELLFRCNIISTQEFAYSRVSKEHIDECVWIGTYMLHQKPLSEWVALWEQAQQTFEDSVSACFTERTNMRSERPRSEVPALDCNRVSSQGGSEDDPENPYTTRSSLCLSQIKSPTSEYRREANALRDSEFGRGSGDARQRMVSPLIQRCNQIMSAPPQEGVPVQRAGYQQVASPLVPQVRPVVSAVPRLPSEASLSPWMGSVVPSQNVSPSIPSAMPSANVSPAFVAKAPSFDRDSSLQERVRAALMQPIPGQQPILPHGPGGDLQFMPPSTSELQPPLTNPGSLSEFPPSKPPPFPILQSQGPGKFESIPPQIPPMAGGGDAGAGGPSLAPSYSLQSTAAPPSLYQRGSQAESGATMPPIASTASLGQMRIPQTQERPLQTPTGSVGPIALTASMGQISLTGSVGPIALERRPATQEQLARSTSPATQRPQ